MWTEERVALLRKLWAEGLSAGQIAIKLGMVTRNACIGKIHRLKIQRRVDPHKATRINRQRILAYAPPRQRAPKFTKTPIVERPEPITPLNTPILQITDFQCKAIVDQTEWGNAKCCGHRAETGKSFCTAHEAMFFTLQPRGRAA